jgi:hypothetical protein
MLPNVILAGLAIVFIAVLGNVIRKEIGQIAKHKKNI